MQIFIDVCQQGSFARAAQRQGCSPSAISKAIERLEQNLNAVLFLRSTRKLELTENGKAYYACAEQITEQLNHCEAEIAGNIEKPVGTLKLNLAVPFGRLCVQPMLREFCRRYPHINLDIQYSDYYADMIQQGIDITIRTGEIDDSRLIGRKLSPLYLVTCTANQYFGGQKFPTSIDELQAQRWIRLKFKQSGRLLPITVETENGPVELDPGKQIIVDNAESMTELCADGHGLAQLPHFATRTLLEREKLQAIDHPIKSPKYAIHLLYARQNKTPTKVKRFIEQLQAYLASIGDTPEHSWAASIIPRQG